MESIWNLVIYFAICSFIGWMIQSVEELITKRKLTNSGFLYGPFIPVFGFTALAIYLFNLYFIQFPIYIRLIGFFIIPTAIEYFTGYLLEKIFKVKLWDYSKQRFNLKGRISLFISGFWFVIILFHVFILQKIIFDGINQFGEISRIILAGGLIIYFSVDFFFSTKLFYNFAKIKKEFERNKKINLRKLNSKIKSIQRKMKISPVFKRNIKDDLEKFIERFNKK
jgi:uncharacterized membrane protein